MRATTKHGVHESVKPNGKWLSKVLERGEKATLAKSRVILDMAQDTASEMINDGSDLAKKAGEKAVSYGKAHPIRVAFGGLAVGFLLGSRLLARPK